MKKDKISVTKLLVNPENPRFNPVKNQKKAIDLMLIKMSKKILNLAEDIAQHGLNPSKSLMVIKINKNAYLPLEGNRRVTAVKLLNNPNIASDKNIKESFMILKEKYEDRIPNSIECVIFSDKESANRWVKLEHTGENKGIGVVKWNSRQIKRFDTQHTGKKSSSAMQLFDFAKQNKIDYQKVDVTTLERVISTPFVREQIGIDIFNGDIGLIKSKKDVIKNLNKVFSKMSKNNFKVADVYTVGKRKEWIINLLGISKSVKKDDADKTFIKTSKSTKDPLDGDWITNELYRCYDKENRIRSILKELKSTKPQQKVNMCAVSLRVLLELLTYSFLDEKGEISKIIENQKNKIIKENQKRKDKEKPEQLIDENWSPQFKDMLKHMIREALIMNPQTRKAIETYINKKSNEAFLDELNQFIHNIDYEPSPQDVENIWKQFGKKLFKIVFNSDQNESSTTTKK